MNSNETQLALVVEKVNALHVKIEALDGRIEDVLSWQRQRSESSSPGTHYQALNHDLSNHKDVLSDEKRQPGDREATGGDLSSDIQIQRLTAQLTAAYGRIAALEEQLLARRES
ncbi:MAG: hypothetical protein AAGB01_08240 [Cyanobacteria bacterium P01_F01_bin.42]